ncbi:MAG: c-type cytochrome [Bdellovibrionales bacterium]
MIFWFFLNMAWAQSSQLTAEGEYLVRAASCRECHTQNESQPFAGGLALPTQFGIFYTPNITTDKETGIGKWTAAQFQRAMRLGVSPQHQIYYPVFPYRSFSKMTNEDIYKIFFYLRSLPPIRKPNRPHDLSLFYNQRWLLFFWQELYFRKPLFSNPMEGIKSADGPFVNVPDRSETWNRGAYLVEAVTHCAECHTPRDYFGGPESSQWMAGSDILFSGKAPPNITPDPETGITWSRQEWSEFLASGVDPQGNSPGVEMALAVRATSQLTKADRDAMVEYLLSLTPVRRYSRGSSP